MLHQVATDNNNTDIIYGADYVKHIHSFFSFQPKSVDGLILALRSHHICVAAQKALCQSVPSFSAVYSSLGCSVRLHLSLCPVHPVSIWLLYNWLFFGRPACPPWRWFMAFVKVTVAAVPTRQSRAITSRTSADLLVRVHSHRGRHPHTHIGNTCSFVWGLTVEERQVRSSYTQHQQRHTHINVN